MGNPGSRGDSSPAASFMTTQGNLMEANYTSGGGTAEFQNIPVWRWTGYLF